MRLGGGDAEEGAGEGEEVLQELQLDAQRDVGVVRACSRAVPRICIRCPPTAAPAPTPTATPEARGPGRGEGGDEDAYNGVGR